VIDFSFVSNVVIELFVSSLHAKNFRWRAVIRKYGKSRLEQSGVRSHVRDNESGVLLT
jgi:hypothetical protein